MGKARNMGGYHTSCLNMAFGSLEPGQGYVDEVEGWKQEAGQRP